MKNERRSFLEKTAFGAFLIPIISKIDFSNFLTKNINWKKSPKIKVKPNSYAVKRTKGE